MPHNRRIIVSDPLRSDAITVRQHDDAERDAKIESLLLAGLDHYFASNYTQAIDVWTRALFLDRAHPRARAYIERARSALAERLRESEELLHGGIAAFERGQIDAARELLNAAVDRGAAHDVALAFLTRIDRIRAAAPLEPAGVPPVPSQTGLAHAQSRPHPGLHALAILLALALIAGAALLLASWGQLRAAGLLPGASGAGAPALPAAPMETLEIPRSGEAALQRARALFLSGRAHDALRALTAIRAADPRRPDADVLKEEIQRELLAHGGPDAGALETR